MWNPVLPKGFLTLYWSATMTDVVIPRLIHQIRLGDRPMHPNMEAWRRRWQALHPGWMYRLWHEKSWHSGFARHLHNDTDDLIITLGPEHSDLIRRAANLSQRSNIWRYNLMYWVGGLYIDTDIEPYKPIDDLVADLSAFTCARTHQHRPLECALIGAVPKHPWLCELKDRLVEADPAVSKSMGVDYFTPITEKYLDTPSPDGKVAVLPERQSRSSTRTPGRGTRERRPTRRLSLPRERTPGTTGRRTGTQRGLRV